MILQTHKKVLFMGIHIALTSAEGLLKV